MEELASSNQPAFTKKDSLAVKGAAILMMMWHHCFLSGRFEKFEINFWPLDQSQVVNIANFCKICVSLFAFLSGYGLYLSYQRKKERSSSNWILEREIRTLSGYWFVLILSWLVCGVIDNRPYRAYGFKSSVLRGIWNMLIEFLGLSNFVGNEVMNGTWWYMSAAVVFVFLLPIMYASFEKMGCLYTLGIVIILSKVCVGFPGHVHFLSFFPAFCIGMAFSRHDLFSKWNSIRHSLLKRACLLAAVGIAYKLYYFLPTAEWWDIKYGLFPIPVILSVYELGRLLPFAKRALAFLGAHATNIFLVHTFIRYYYFEEFTYGMKHFAAVIAVLLVISLLISIVLEMGKKAVHYGGWIEKITLCFTGSRQESASKEGTL